MQKHWSPGTQCVTKHDHAKPKGQELAFRKGDVVTIIEAVEVSAMGAVRDGRDGIQCRQLCCWSQVPSSLALRPSCPQGKGWYRAKHNGTGQEGLLAASALRERGAIRADPKLSLMP